VAVTTDSEMALRNQYLQTLGVVQYIPKELSEAAQPNSLDQPVEIAETEQVSQTSREQAAPSSKLAIDLDDRSSAKKHRPAKTAVVAAPEDKGLKLTFALWQPTAELLICSAVEDQLPDPQQIDLLTNIVAAMDKSAPSLPQLEVVNWPPHANMQGDETEVREYLSTLIKARVEAGSTKTLLMLGELTEQWLLSAEQRAAAVEGILPISDKVAALMVPSLAQMLADPDCKRLTWRIICAYFAMPAVLNKT